MESLFSAENMAEFSAFFGRHYFMCMIWVFTFAGLIFVQLRMMTARIKKVTSAGATFMVNHENGLYLDVRSADAFGKGHIAGSENVSAADIKAGKVQRVGADLNRPLIMVGRDKYDSDAFNSARALKKQGYTKVFSLEGGIAQWQIDNLPLSIK